MRRYLAVLLAAAAVLAWCMIQPTDDRTQLVFGNSHGATTQGSKLGVTIGQAWGDADVGIRRKFKPSSVLCYVPVGESGTQFLREPPQHGLSFVSYRDDSWRNGSVLLEFHDGRVARISWNYAPFGIDL
jgi:hypothetical protein